MTNLELTFEYNLVQLWSISTAVCDVLITVCMTLCVRSLVSQGGIH